MPRPGRGPSKLLVTGLLSIALLCGLTCSVGHESLLSASSGSARVVAGSSTVQAIMARAVDVETRGPRRGGSPLAGAAAIGVAMLASLRRRRAVADHGWGHTSGGPGRAQDRAPPLPV